MFSQLGRWFGWGIQFLHHIRKINTAISKNLSLQRTNHVPLSYEVAPLHLLIRDISSTTTLSLKRQQTLQAQLSLEHFTILVEETASQVTRTHNRCRSELSSKFFILLTPRQAHIPPKKTNLSQRTLSMSESSIQKRGMKFNTADADTTSFVGNLISILSHPTIPEGVRSDGGKRNRPKELIAPNNPPREACFGLPQKRPDYHHPPG